MQLIFLNVACIYLLNYSSTTNKHLIVPESLGFF